MGQTSLIREQIALEAVTEFRGNPPDVPLASHINLESLTEGDDNPFFATLKIGKSDVMSGNNNYYDGQNVREIGRQVVGLDANMGHVPESESDSSYPMPAGHWVGALMDAEGVLWGKMYIPKTRPDVREFMRIKKAQNGKVSTSIFSFAKRNYDAKLGGYRLSEIAVETVDLAPLLRAGVRDLATVPAITREMQAEDGEAMGDNTFVDKYGIIAEMTVKDVPYIPEAVREQVIAVSPERRLVVEMGQVLGVADTDFVARVKELLAIERKHAEIVAEQLKRLIADEVTAQVMPNVAQVTDGVKAVREMVINAVVAGKPQDADAVKAAVADVVKMPMVQEMARLALSAMGNHERGSSSGPRGGAGGDEVRAKYLNPKPTVEGEGA